MGEKNEIKVKLSTVVYLFIILVLVVALGAVYYLGFVKNDNANNIFVNEQVTETDNNQKEDEIKENRFKEGKYSYVNAGRKEIMAQDNKFTLVLLETYIEFDNNNFKVYDNDQLFTSGKYEQISDNLIKCVISDERSFEFKIMEKNELEIIKLNSNDAETEFNIRLYDILGEKNEYVLYEENDLVGTWNTTYVYKDMGGGDFWKIEEHQIDEKFTFDNKGTYNKKENSEVSEGTYELEINRIYTSKDSGGMYLIDEDTILYTLGTEYKIILSKNSNNEFEQDLNKYKGKEAISLIAKENTRFVINEIKNNGDTYIINASILEKEPRKILEDEYNDILEGQEVTFRDIKWKYDKSINDEYATYLKSNSISSFGKDCRYI